MVGVVALQRRPSRKRVRRVAEQSGRITKSGKIEVGLIESTCSSLILHLPSRHVGPV
ncbi:hypothetical protein CY34DRAFT_802088 [Suillus luteus UH-Slu-Lm8-n1]|uniref:Uncharacterized protein n=1 Tax=Suillus luteus UH-Slu-Lm8-n1 TaxID=930992 RepID=A0A0D0BG05_9AGAM|nr:hypothetical protein CY34DRAFT_802088 [Suillus luteus UH-Slu-Lm8-n1]